LGFYSEGNPVSRDLVFDRDGKPYARAHLTAEQQAEQDAKNKVYWAWVDARMQKRFSGTLAEYKAALQDPADLAARTVKELRILARERRVKGRSKMLKAELVKAIERSWMDALPDAPGLLLQKMMEPQP